MESQDWPFSGNKSRDGEIVDGAGGDRHKSPSRTHGGATGGITLGNAPVFVDLKFSGRRLFWLRAIICYVRVESRGPPRHPRRSEQAGSEKGETERRAATEGGVRPSCPFGTGRMLNRITIRHGDVIHLHYYFSRERPRDPASYVSDAQPSAELAATFSPLFKLRARNSPSQIHSAIKVIKRTFRRFHFRVLICRNTRGLLLGRISLVF